MSLVSFQGLMAAHLRWNQAGYPLKGDKVLLAMSEQDLAGQAWIIERKDTADGSQPAEVLRGNFGASLCGAGDHSPFAFNHTADFSSLSHPGAYRFRTGAEQAQIIVSADPYSRFIPEALTHLRMMRSGDSAPAPRKPSHRGDARALVTVPSGEASAGKWKPASPARTVDVSGGWYDAGDQIKFTLNIAYTSYHLLYAWRIQRGLPDYAGKSASLSALLDEARHGLDFLCRVFPDPETFVIQVGDEQDHNQPLRLPENDLLDGKRPALCALSRTHMASASAALALGSRCFGEIGRKQEAGRYRDAALAMFRRSQGPGTVATAFERGEVNDFYRDDTEADQVALAAAELYALTREGSFLELARRQAPPAGAEVSWGSWNWLANAALAPHDKAARARLIEEARGYARHAAERGAPWVIPGAYTWGSLHRWVGAANACRVASLELGGDRTLNAVFQGMLDYTFGRNNWGVSFVFSEKLPNTLRNLYSPLYAFLRLFPTGALSEGPGERRLHESLDKYFSIPADDPGLRFNTSAAVFHDNSSDFMCQEATIGGQGDLVLMLSLAAAR